MVKHVGRIRHGCTLLHAEAVETVDRAWGGGGEHSYGTLRCSYYPSYLTQRLGAILGQTWFSGCLGCCTSVRSSISSTSRFVLRMRHGAVGNLVTYPATRTGEALRNQSISRRSEQ